MQGAAGEMTAPCPPPPISEHVMQLMKALKLKATHSAATKVERHEAGVLACNGLRNGSRIHLAMSSATLRERNGMDEWRGAARPLLGTRYATLPISFTISATSRCNPLHDEHIQATSNAF